MKSRKGVFMNKNWILISVLLAGMLLSACQPAPAFTSVDGVWTTNVGILTLTQNGNEVTGQMAGYGGGWNFPLTGLLDGNVVSFTGDLPWGDGMSMTFAGNGQSFRSNDPTLSFCGSRSETLPMGCGFSGKWMMKYVMAHDGAYADLIQAGDQVTGMIYNSRGEPMSTLAGTVSWGKGWRAEAQTDWGKMTLSLTSDEKAFEIDAGAEFCGLRDTEVSAYVFYFDCQP
jgi:hypothetical protein